eukprot:CAMPEP_0170746492 /NCGR_PEP_ID=MMETSP0437-20130122/8837_1 /TAXON_ID=0 /ORGANISM="Sexangularia sp." /LENGTH=126 /DNA_ID=CAMNT_0011085245 /DNA_START=36 /DNA_END=416 /DNA_ORIENTATION=+
MTAVANHEDWEYYNNELQKQASGNGIESLKAALPSDGVGFAVFRIQAENVGNVGAGIMTEANVILQWKGPSSKAMAKNKNNGALQKALDTLKPNKGFIEVLGTVNLNTENIFDRWRPGSGSKVIDD